MKPEKKRVSYRQAWRLTLRAWRVWWKLCPGYFVSSALSAVFKALQAYAGIYFSARIIGEVNGCNRVLYDITTKPPASIEWE